MSAVATNWPAEYRKYLQSDHWRSLRRAALERDNYRCVKCPSRQHLEIHHLLYRNQWEDTQLMDLQTLCAKCHEEHHPHLKTIHHPRKINRKTTFLRRKRRQFFAKKRRFNWSF